jgi:hypothetical protein
MRKVLRWVGSAALTLVAVLALTAAVFWFTVPPTPTLPEGFEPPAPDSVVTEPALREELLRMLALDQAVRESSAVSGLDMSSTGGVWRLLQDGVRMWRVDRPNTERLKAIVEEEGWPTRAAVGRDGRRAVFLLVQHADRDPAFQRAALDPMRAAYVAGDASGSELALLTDRVRKATGEPQLYGSQIHVTPGSPPTLWPVEDEANVDARRAEMGLPPLAEYLATTCTETGMCVGR